MGLRVEEKASALTYKRGKISEAGLGWGKREGGGNFRENC